MKQWFLNLMRRLDNLEVHMGRHVDSFELTHVELAHNALAVEVINLDRTQQEEAACFHRQQALELDNLIARHQIERIDKTRKLANLAYRKAWLESRVGTQAESKTNNRVTWG